MDTPPPSATTARSETRPGERAAVIVLALVAFAVSVNASVMGALVPFLEVPFGIDPSQKARLIGIASLGQAVSALLLGPVIDRYGRRRLLVLGLLLFAAGSALHLAATSYGMLIAVRVATGMAGGVAYAAASALLADLVPYERRGAAMGTFTAGMYLAFPVALPAANWLANRGDWSAIFVAQAAIAGIVATLALPLLPASSTGPWRWPFALLKRPRVVPAVLTVALHVGAFVSVIQLCGDWMNSQGILPKERQDVLWLVIGTAPVLGSLLLSPLSDRFGKRVFVLVTTAGLSVCLALLANVSSLGALFAVGVVLAILAAARTGPMQALMSNVVPRAELGQLMGLRGAGMYFGIYAFLEVAGQLYEAYGFPAVLYAASGCVAVAWLLVFVFLPEER